MNYQILKSVLRIAVYAIVAFLSLSIYYFYIYVRPSRWKSESSPKLFDLEYEDVVLKTSDSFDLSGWFIPQKNSDKAVIVCHGYPTNKANVLDVAGFLAPYYNVFLFDFRALGDSGGRFASGGWKEREDFLTAVRFLKDKGFSDIGALGFSMGGAVILMSESKDLKAIVSDSSYAKLEWVLHVIFKNFGPIRYPFVKMMKLYYRLLFKTNMDQVAPARYISKIRTPVFLIHSERDSQIPIMHLELLRHESPRSTTWIIPDADHGEGHTLKQREYQEKILTFFRDNL